MLWDGRRAPFTLIGGYLGAGKTTVVNHLVRHSTGRRLVVLVNDIGAVNVDADLIADHNGTTLSLTNGCVCCSIADDLGQTLEKIRELPEPPDHIVMELSGVAEPARVAPWASTAGFRLDGIVVVADAEQLVEQVERAYVGDTVRSQLTAADLVLLTKSDLAPPGPATQVIAGLTTAPVVSIIDGEFEPSLVFGLTAATDRTPPDANADMRYVTDVIDVDSPSIDELRELVDGLDRSVLRAKGLLRCRGEEHPLEVHVVGRRRTIRSRQDLPIERSSTKLVVIRIGAGGC